MWWLVIRLFRFLTGAHLNGKTYNDATWFQDASPLYRKRRAAYTWWRRKARIKRAAWRNAILWMTVLIFTALVWSVSSTLIILGCMSPALAYVTFRKLRGVLYNPVTSSNSDGSVKQLWIMKPKTRRALNRIHRPAEMRRRPGLARPHEIERKVRLKEIPPDVKGAVVREIADEFDGQPPTALKLLMAPDDE